MTSPTLSADELAELAMMYIVSLKTQKGSRRFAETHQINNVLVSAVGVLETDRLLTQAEQTYLAMTGEK